MVKFNMMCNWVTRVDRLPRNREVSKLAGFIECMVITLIINPCNSSTHTLACRGYVWTVFVEN